MVLKLNPGEKFTAEIEKRLPNGRLETERVNFMAIKNFSGDVVFITDGLKTEDKDIIFRAYKAYELKNVSFEADTDDELTIEVEA